MNFMQISMKNDIISCVCYMAGDVLRVYIKIEGIQNNI